MPTKAIYETFDQNPDREFDHFLCKELGWQSVERMRREMSAAEWNDWRIFYARKAQRAELANAQGG